MDHQAAFHVNVHIEGPLKLFRHANAKGLAIRCYERTGNVECQHVGADAEVRGTGYRLAARSKDGRADCCAHAFFHLVWTGGKTDPLRDGILLS